ncbi:MAG: hypothetical protein KIPDCIKN_00858 [Haliscomenobacter sp.]|nr:hypothetical protein [Haliscomenobacter sp.]
MKIIVTDTNVFIDLVQSGALDFFFQCPFDICTTDLVLEELNSDQRALVEKHIASAHLQVFELSDKEIMEALNLKTECNLKRITDKSILLKAIQLKACLLTGDGDLRKEGKRAGLEVRGSLWVIREIWTMGLSDKKRVLEMLEKLSMNTRLPKTALDELKNEILGNQ